MVYIANDTDIARVLITKVSDGDTENAEDVTARFLPYEDEEVVSEWFNGNKVPAIYTDDMTLVLSNLFDSIVRMRGYNVNDKYELDVHTIHSVRLLPKCLTM